MSGHDTRYQQEKWLARRKVSTRIALMYLPLLTIVTTDSSFLNLLQLDYENNNDTVKNNLTNNENENCFDVYTADGYKSKMLLIFVVVTNDNYFVFQFQTRIQTLKTT